MRNKLRVNYLFMRHKHNKLQDPSLQASKDVGVKSLEFKQLPWDPANINIYHFEVH